MIKYVLVLFCMPAFAVEVRWATRLSSDVHAAVEALRECGVEGRVLRWRSDGVWKPHLLVTRLPVRVVPCRASWLFLHDAEALARLREFMVTHEGLLLNLRGFDTPQLVRAEGGRGFKRLHEIEPAIGEAILLLRADSDLYDIVGALRRFDDLVRGYSRKTDERFYALNLPKVLLEPTLNFIREARVAAAKAHALADAKRDIEFQFVRDGDVMPLRNPVVARLHREQRLVEARADLAYVLPFFERAHFVVHSGLPVSLRETYDVYLADALRPADFRVLGLAAAFPKCADDLTPESAAAP